MISEERKSNRYTDREKDEKVKRVQRKYLGE
jgi:hypothetical protein